MLKSIQQMFLLALCLLFPSVAGAARLTVEGAKDVAAEFFQSGAAHRLANKDALVLAHTLTDDASNPICYVFNAKDGNGFVIISADESSMPVIGYSLDSAWNLNMVPDAAQSILSAPVLMSTDSRRKVAQMRAGEVQSKLLETPSWSQEAPFNNLIPNRRLTGCVGVALAEILKFHGYPQARPASLVNSGDAASYNWTMMRNDNYRSGYSDEEAHAVATLVADAAIAIGTDFGMSSSSAFEVKVPYALASLFGYDSGVSYKKRSELSKSAWDSVIVNEINEGRPVLYSGQDVSSGHAFVCDGYELRGGVPYFHINWGWGGSANGYFASDALNPVVSKAHSYNDLMTIIYNIKPAADSTLWSDIHVTSDERQPGLTMDADHAAASFTVRAGALKNISNSDFSGKLAVALFDAAGNRKCLLSDGRNFSLIALQVQKYVDFSCSLPAGTTVADGDVVRLVTMTNGSSEWLPVAGDLLAPGHALAKEYEIPYFSISLPDSSADAAVSASSSAVIKGRDYAFTVTPMSADKVITVKANGFILTPDASNVYRISNVLEDQKIDVLVQNAADVLSKSTLWVTAGNLENLLSEQEAATVVDLTLFGTINVNDFNFMRDRMKLERLDISQVSIVANGSNPANAIPTKAFTNCRSLKQIILPNNLTTFKNGCLAQTGLTSVEVPASVGTWEYNVFVGCNALREVIVRRSSPAWINWCVFNGTPKTKLVVPVGATAAYKAKEYWQDFQEIVEENPVAPDHFTLTVAEMKGVRFTPLTEGTQFNPGAGYSFSAETDDSFGDATMQVFANSERLYPDNSGNFNAVINANTLIHFEFSYPEAATADNAWKLTGAEGGVGLVTDVVNVPAGSPFTVRANAIKVPNGAEASKFFAMALTDRNGGIKEIISPVMTNSMTNYGNLAFNFVCQVKEASIKEGNELRLITSYNKKNWTYVVADADGVADRIKAVGNQVAYHRVNMPQTISGARIEGAVTEIVRGMPLSVKVTPDSPMQRVTLAVNGVNKAVSAAVANVTVPSVTEDLEITVSIHDAGASDFVVVNVQEGELAAKIAECPDRLKVMGTILVEEFSAFAAHANRILDLDLADMTVKGAAMTGNSVPTNAFAPAQAGGTSVLRSIILPKNLERISDNAFARCGALKEVVVPASVNYVGSGAFAACNQLSKITMEGTVPPATGSMSPFPSATSGIALVVPRGYEGAYSTGFWGLIAPKEQKYSYWVKFDPTRAFIFNSNAISNPNNIEVGSSKVDVTVGLPNCPTLSKSGAVYRKGVVFKVYDNGRETTKDYSVSGMNIGGEVYLTGGQYYFQMDPNINPVYNDYPKNHTVDVVFFYPIDVELLDGASGVTSEVIASAEEDKFNATLSKYEYGVPGTRLVYREGKDYKVRLSAPVDNMTLSVEIENRIMTKPGESPEYETVTFEAYPDEEGLYVIPSLPGDTKVKVTGSIKVVEGEPLDAELIANVSKADVADFTELIVEGSMEEEDFRNIRDKFESVETVDLTSMESTVIPAGAFEGMDQLIDVIVSDNVTEIGAGAFKDCGNIESLTLPGVTSIGEGAFDGCESLTSILLPALDDSHAAGKPGMRRAGAADGVSAESFKGLNPNCLIYVGSVDILDSESLNIILNKDGSRVAASDIMLDGNHPFNAPASFLLGDHKISFAAEITASDSCDVDGGWKTIMLPFRPTEMEIGCEFAKREGSGLHILSFDGADSEVMTAQSEILPNRPYLANVCAPFASVPVTFSASARKQVEGEDIVYDVPFTPVPEELVAAGKSFSLFGSYDGESRNVECMMLNESASAFVSGGDTDCKVTPFSAYLCANEGVAETGMKVGEHPLWIREPQVAGESGNRLYRSGKIEMSAPNANASIYYTVDGSDPKAAEGTRRLYSAPFSMEGESMSVKAVAEYKGNLSDIVTFDYELRKAGVDFNLVENWNWISHHTENPVAIADFATAGIDSIVSQTGNAVVDPVKGVTGTLTHLLPVQGYKVRVSGSSWTGSLSGVAYDPAAVVKLASGWNWIGTPADGCSFRIKDLLSGLEVEEGDMIVGLDGFSQVDAEGEWKGTLHEMLPGVGYMFYSNSDKEFVYNIVESCDDEAPAKAPEDTDWTVDIHKYASVMPVVASVEAAAGINADDCRVAAFCGDECRGTGVDVDGSVLINVHGNPGDMINFYVINGEGQELVSTSKLVFEEKPEGTFAQPFAVKVGDTSGIETVTVGSVGISYAGGALTMSGDLSNVEAVEVYDMTGKMIARSAGAGALPIGSVDGSVVTVVIRKADATLSAKLIIR